MEVPVKLLANGVDDDRVLIRGELVYPFRPKRDGEADEENGFDQDDSELEVSRDSAPDPFMIGDGVFAAAETEKDVNEKGRPTDEERTHEPMRELDNVIDLITVLGSVRRQPDELVDQGEAIPHVSNLRRSAAGAARVECGRVPKVEAKSPPPP